MGAVAAQPGHAQAQQQGAFVRDGVVALVFGLRLAHRSQRGAQVTEVAMENGFTHMGRFAGYYKKRFGCTPTQTLKGG